MPLGMEEGTPRPTKVDSYFPPHLPMDGDRPPGGTRRSGTKTPRKVQWQDSDEPLEATKRALDEHGLDVRKSTVNHCSATLIPSA